jgi:hypothetical protein
MKQLIFLSTAVTLFFFSCSTNKNLSKHAESFENDFNSPDNYFKDSSFIETKLAESMIYYFPNHNYRGVRKNRLRNAWATFSPALLSKVNDNKNKNVLKVTFFLATILEKGDKYLLPTVIMQVKLNSAGQSGKGSADESLPQTSLSYYRPIDLCPPPSSNCKLDN